MLLLLVPAAWWWIWAWKRTLRLTGPRRIAAFALRAAVMLLLVAVAAGLEPAFRHEYRAVVFVADRSASVADDARIARWIGEAIGGKDEDDRAGVVSFGRRAAAERPLTADGGRPALRAQIDPSYSNVADGLRLAAGMLPKGGRIVLLTDGRSNIGDAIREARLLRSQGIAVDVVPLPAQTPEDAAIESLVVPASVKLGERFTIELEAASTVDGEAEIRLYENEREIVRETVRLSRGINRFLLQHTAGSAGMNRYRAEIDMPGDERAQNDAAYAFSRIDGPPRVLIVEGEPGSSANIASALEASLIPYDLVAPEQLPVELADYARYDAIVLNDVPATRLSATVMERLASAVGDLGVGLVAAGGSDSFGLGGYYGTPLERALPVYTDLKGRRQMPSLALIFVIDRSGSMDGGKLDLAKEAALRSIELLRDADTVGVVAFDDSPWWVVEPAELRDRGAVEDAILGIPSEGGTDIYPAVSAALDRMLEIDARRRHIILLTDGMSAGYGNYQALTDAMNEAGITMSTVAVGADADTALLRRLAEAANGRFYYTTDASTIPSIFSRETVMMTRTYVVENRFVPAIGQAGNWTPLFMSGVPAVDAYVATTSKETAETVLLTPEGDPLLARWSYGAGRSVAWTSDLAGRWAADWTLWPAFPDVLAAWVKWTFPQFSADLWQVRARLEGGAAELEITAQGDVGAGSLTVYVTGDDGGAVRLEPVPTAPGEYALRMDDARPGAYFMQIGEGGEAGDAASGGALAGFVIPYSPEYRIAGEAEGADWLADIARLTGGRTLSLERPEEVFRAGRIAETERTDPSRALLIAALLLWLADIAVRRLSLPWRAMAAALAGRTAGRAANRMETSGAEVLVRLGRRTRSAGEFYAGGEAGRTGHRPDEGGRVPGGSGRRTDHAGRRLDEAGGAADDAGGQKGDVRRWPDGAGRRQDDGRTTAAGAPAAGSSPESAGMPSVRVRRGGGGAAAPDGSGSGAAAGSGFAGTGSAGTEAAAGPVPADTSAGRSGGSAGSAGTSSGDGGASPLNRLLAAKRRADRR
jgi:uncharacterized protein YegL